MRRNDRHGGCLIVLGVIGAVLLLALGAVGYWAWKAAPEYAEREFVQIATDLGFETAGISIPAIGLERTTVHDVVLENRGLRIEAGRIEARYLPENLIRGDVGLIEVEDLVITLDYTKPGSGWLPDGVLELIPESDPDSEISWPLQRLEVKQARIDMVFPDTVHSFVLNISSWQESDERDRFVLDFANPWLAAQASASLDVATLDGAVELTRFSLAPAFLEELASKLGSFSLPPESHFESDRIEVSGQLDLVDGALGDGGGIAVIPRLRLGYPGLEGEVSSAEVTMEHRASEGFSGAAMGHVIMYGTDAQWSAGPVRIESALDRGRVSLHAAQFPVAWSDTVELVLSLSAASGVPSLGGDAEFQGRVLVDEGQVAGHGIEPVAIGVNGWADAFSAEIPNLGFRDLPVSLLRGVLSVSDLSGSAPKVQGGVEVHVTGSLSEYLPEGVNLLMPAGGFQVGTLEIASEINAQGAATGYQGVFRSRIDEVVAAHEATTISMRPDILMTVALRNEQLGGQIDATMDRIATNHAGWPKDLDRMSMRTDLGSISIETLMAMIDGAAPTESVGMTAVFSTLGSTVNARATLDVGFDAVARSWNAAHHFEANDLGTAIQAIESDALQFQVDTVVGPVAHQELKAWSAAESLPMLLEHMLPVASIKARATASRIEAPGQARAEWCSLGIEKPVSSAGEPLISARLTASAGNLRSGPEVIEQPSVTIEIAGDLDLLDVEAGASALFEGLSVEARSRQKVAIDWDKATLSGAGEFGFEPLTLANSDILSRWSPELKGLSFGATVDVSGSVAWDSLGHWDGSAEMVMRDGRVVYPPQKLTLEGLAARIRFDALPDLSTRPGQTIRFSRLDFGDVQIFDGSFALHNDGLDSLSVEEAQASVFGGTISTDSFSLTFPIPDAAIVINAQGLDLAEIDRFIKPFQGNMTGRLNGRIPLGIIGGKFILGQGILELDSSVPATFSYPADGLFTKDMPAKGVANQLNRLPYELLEEGLNQVDVSKLRVELFNRDRPETPIRIELSGSSTTERATVPFEIVTNVNGTFAEVINLVMRLASL